MFVECIPSGTRRISDLPSAALKTLGKIGGLPSVKKTLGKEIKYFFWKRRRRKKIKIKIVAEC